MLPPIECAEFSQSCLVHSCRAAHATAVRISDSVGCGSLCINRRVGKAKRAHEIVSADVIVGDRGSALRALANPALAIPFRFGFSFSKDVLGEYASAFWSF